MEESELIKKMFAEGKSLAKIGDELGVSRATAFRKVQELGLKREDIRIKKLNEEWLKKKYTVEKMTIQGISEEAGTTYKTVAKNLKYYGIELEKRGNGGRKTMELDETELRKAYIEDNKGVTEIAEELGISFIVVRRNLIDYGIPIIRKRREGSNVIDIDLEEMTKLFYDEWPIEDIADHFYISASTIKKRIDKLGLKRNIKRKPVQLGKARLNREYTLQQKTLNAIAEDNHTSVKNVKAFLMLYKIPERPPINTKGVVANWRR